MNSQLLNYTCFIKSLSYIFLFTLALGCGAVGSPIPPEDVGIEAKVRKQQKENTQTEEVLSEDGVTPVEEEDVELPDFYPIGRR